MSLMVGKVNYRIACNIFCGSFFHALFSTVLVPHSLLLQVGLPWDIPTLKLLFLSLFILPISGFLIPIRLFLPFFAL